MNWFQWIWVFATISTIALVLITILLAILIVDVNRINSAIRNGITEDELRRRHHSFMER